MEEVKQKRSIFASRIKSANVKIFPEALLGYLLGPILALFSNSVINTYLLRYYTDVMDLNSPWAGNGLFLVLLQVCSAIIIIIGNIVVGKLMEKKKTKVGKARPLLVAGLPLIALAIFVMFFAPFPEENSSNIWTLILIAVGYNLYYAIAYPFYYTSHSALVNLSTRNSNYRGLLATLSNASVVAAAGIAGMFMPYFLNLLFVPSKMVQNVNGVDIEYEYDSSVFDTSKGWSISGYDKEASFNNWKIFMIVLIVTVVIGIIIEFLFTRERITEEELAKREISETEENSKKSIPMSKQIKVCLTDKYWWLVMVFFLLYQLGGMLKNNSASYYSVAWFGDSSMAGTISIIGAIPTAVGMVIAPILATKIGKGKSIGFGAIVACGCGLIGFIGYNSSSVNAAIPIVAFVLKALGTVPAMYVSLALLSDVLDHQEALYGFRTDGFSMAVYGSIMIAMTGIANGVIAGLMSVAGYSASVTTSTSIRNMSTWLFFGGEVICYAIIALLFIPLMNVEKYTKLDHLAIEEDQRALALANGEEYVPAEIRMKEEQEKSEAEAKEAYLAELKLKCEKKNISYEDELAKYNEKEAQKEETRKLKEAQKREKDEAKAKLKEEKYNALSDEEKEKIHKKEEARKLKEEKLEEEYEALRERAKSSPLHI